MNQMLASPKLAGILGTYDNMRGKLNIVTLVTAFILSIMVINTHNECTPGKGFSSDAGFVKMSYGISVTILVIVVLLFAMDIFNIVIKKMH